MRIWTVAATALVAVGIGIWAFLASRGDRAEAQAPTPPSAEEIVTVRASTPERAGRYLVMVAGCNDCHTPGFMEKGYEVPESEWLTGVPLGWRGPWGTTYASNLRLYARETTEDLWVEVLRARTARPPMPWPNIHAMSEADLRAIYRYIRSLPVRGEKMPDYVPPDEEPRTPYITMAPPTMPSK